MEGVRDGGRKEKDSEFNSCCYEHSLMAAAYQFGSSVLIPSLWDTTTFQLSPCGDMVKYSPAS